jgi:hypothetical protein
MSSDSGSDVSVSWQKEREVELDHALLGDGGGVWAWL